MPRKRLDIDYECCYCKTKIKGDYVEFGEKGNLTRAHENCLIKNTNMEYYGTKTNKI